MRKLIIVCLLMTLSFCFRTDAEFESVYKVEVFKET